jgi:hypothetical protein
MAQPWTKSLHRQFEEAINSETVEAREIAGELLNEMRLYSNSAGGRSITGFVLHILVSLQKILGRYELRPVGCATIALPNSRETMESGGKQGSG